MSDIVVLKSADRISGTNVDGVIRLDKISALKGRYKISKFVMLNAIYNVSVSNNKVYFKESSILKIGELQAGFYTADELAGNIEISMNAVGVNTYTVTYDSNLHKFIVNSTGNFAFDFAIQTVDSAYKLLGYSQDASFFESTISVSPNAIDLNSHPILYFSCFDGSTSLIDSSNNYSSFYVNVNASFGDTIRQDLVSEELFLEFNSKINFSYAITGDDGKVLSNSNGAEWFLILTNQQ